jgi:hypothetical protein
MPTSGRGAKKHISIFHARGGFYRSSSTQVSCADLPRHPTGSSRRRLMLCDTGDQPGSKVQTVRSSSGISAERSFHRAAISIGFLLVGQLYKYSGGLLNGRKSAGFPSVLRCEDTKVARPMVLSPATSFSSQRHRPKTPVRAARPCLPNPR